MKKGFFRCAVTALAGVCGFSAFAAVTLNDPSVTNTVSETTGDVFEVVGGTREAPICLEDPIATNTTVTLASGAVLRLTAQNNGNVIWKIAAAEGAEAKPTVIVDSTRDWGFDAGGYFTNVNVVVDSARVFWIETRTPAMTDGSVNLEVPSNATVCVGGRLTVGALSGAGRINVNGDNRLLTLTANSVFEGTTINAPLALAEGATLTVPASASPSVAAATAGETAICTVAGDNKVYSLRASGEYAWYSTSEGFDDEGKLVPIGAADTILFTNAPNATLYIGTALENFHVTNGVSVVFGQPSVTQSLANNARVRLDEGATISFKVWDNEYDGDNAKVGAGASFTGTGAIKLLRPKTTFKGTVTLAGTVTIDTNGKELDVETKLAGGKLSGSGVVKFTSYAGAPSFTFSDDWTGTLHYVGLTGTPEGLQRLTTEKSSVKFTGCTKGCWFAQGSATVVGTVIVEDAEDGTPALDHTDMSTSSNFSYSFAKLAGSGTVTNDYSNEKRWVFKDVSAFTGALKTTGKVDYVLGTGADAPADSCGDTLGVNSGRIFITSGTDVTLAAGKTWTAAGGIVVNGTLTASEQLTGLTTTRTGLTVLETDNGDGTYTYAPGWKPVCVDQTKTYDSQTNPYAIATVTDVQGLAEAVAAGRYADAAFRQTADVDLASVNAFAGIGTAEHPFAGTYDGAGHALSNLQLSADKYRGFFLYLAGTVKGVTIENIGFAEGTEFGGAAVAGTALGGARIEGCTARGTFATVTHAAAGLVCAAQPSATAAVYVIGCTNACAITSTYAAPKVAGLVATLNGEGGSSDTPKTLYLTDCVNTGAIRATTEGTFNGGVAGILGYSLQWHNKAVLEGCVNEGTIGRADDTEPRAAAFYSWSQYKLALVDAGGNRLRATDLAFSTVTNGENAAVLTGFDYAKVDGEYLETVTALATNTTYALLRTPDTAPAITLAAGTWIAFDTAKYQQGAVLTDFGGIVAAEGLALTTNTVGGVTTFTAAGAADWPSLWTTEAEVPATIRAKFSTWKTNKAADCTLTAEDEGAFLLNVSPTGMAMSIPVTALSFDGEGNIVITTGEVDLSAAYGVVYVRTSADVTDLKVRALTEDEIGENKVTIAPTASATAGFYRLGVGYSVPQ